MAGILSFAQLVEESKKLPKPKRGRKPSAKAKASDSDRTFAETQQYLRELKLARCIPVSIHLRKTLQTCTCGEQYHSVNNVPLVKKESKTLTHYEPLADDFDASHLPHYEELTEVSIPACPNCFHSQEGE